MKVFITNLPAFYKIKLYNRIAMQIPIFVIFTGLNGNDRNKDFFNGQMNFQYLFLNGNVFKKVYQLIFSLKKLQYTELVIGGWDSLYYWIANLLSNKNKNALAVESSYLESSATGYKAILKRFFLRRVKKIYASGKSNVKLVKLLRYNGEIVITKGVGVFNYIKQPEFQKRNSVKNFLYVGRLVKEKNLEYLIQKFNAYPDLTLNIIGFGKQESLLKQQAKSNIHFIGAVDNNDLPKYYQDADVFILPSISETWGLVVEEALNNGTPVMVSNHVGCAEELINEQTGIVFSLENDNFDEKLQEMLNLNRYNAMRKYISNLDFESREQYQVNCYTR